MSNFGTVQIGRVTLREDRDISQKVDSDGTMTLSMTGQESSPHWTAAQVIQRSQDIRGLVNEFVPVIFAEKTELNGYYQVASVTISQSTYLETNVWLFPWTMDLTWIGNDTNTDIESRLSGAQTRANAYSGTGVRWHAAPVGAVGYWAGASIPGIVNRTSVDGVIPVHTNITFGIDPTWGCPIASYANGRVRILSDGVERSGITFPLDVANWEMNNGLVRIKPLSSGGVLEISAWTGAAWQAKTWDIQESGSFVSIGSSISATPLFNEYELCAVRLMDSTTTAGRITVDITLRRGSRFAEIYIQTETSTSLKIVRATTEAGTVSTNGAWVRPTTADAAGNRYIVGSSQTLTADAAHGGFSLAATVSLGAFVGVEIASAPSGDLAADLFAQYLGAPSELVQGVSR